MTRPMHNVGNATLQRGSGNEDARLEPGAPAVGNATLQRGPGEEARLEPGAPTGNATLQRGSGNEDARLEPGAPTAGNATLQRGPGEEARLEPGAPTGNATLQRGSGNEDARLEPGAPTAGNASLQRGPGEEARLEPGAPAAGNATLQRGPGEEARLEPGAPTGNATLQRGRPEPSSLIFPENLFSSTASPAWHSRGYLPHVDVETAIQHVTFHLADSLPADARLRIETEVRAVPEAQRNTERIRRIEDWMDAGHGCCVLRQDSAAKMVQDAFLHFETIRYRLYAWTVMPNHVHVLFQTLNGWSVTKVVTSWKSFTGRRLASLMYSGMDGKRARLEPGAPTAGNATLQRGTESEEARLEPGVPATGNATLQRGSGSEEARLEPGAPAAGNATLPPSLVRPTGQRGSDVSERRPVWHREYWDRFIRNRRHFEAVREYIHQNPVKANLVNTPEAYRWSSAYEEARLEPGVPTGGNATLQRGSGKKEARLEPGAPTGNATLQRGPGEEARLEPGAPTAGNATLQRGSGNKEARLEPGAPVAGNAALQRGSNE